MTEEITVDLKRRILNQQALEWAAQRYALEIQHRVQKRIGGDAEVLKRIEANMAQCEKAIDILGEELAALS
jgi:hypothetical protein